MVVVIVVLARRELVCPECGLSTKAGYEVDRPVVSRWRHLDLGSSEGGGPRPAPAPKTRAGDKADGPGARRHPARAQMTEQTPTRGSQPAEAPSRRHRVVVTRPRHHHVLEQPAHRGDAAVHRRWRHSLAVPQADNLASRLSPRSSRLLRSRDSRTGQWAPHQRGPSPARPGTVRSSTDRTATVRAHRDGIAAASERGLWKRAHRGVEQQGPPDHPPPTGPLRRRRARHALLRARQASSTARAPPPPPTGPAERPLAHTDAGEP